MATKYACSSCGATMTLAAAVSSVKCPVCRLDMEPVGEVDAAQAPPAPAPGSEPAPKKAQPGPSNSGDSLAVPSGIKIAKAVTDHRPGHGAPAIASAPSPAVEAAAQRLMADARQQADKIVQEAQEQREDILQHAETHAREQVDSFFEKARNDAADIEANARQEAEKILEKAKQEAEAVVRKTTAQATESSKGETQQDSKELADLKAEAEKNARLAAEKLAEAEARLAAAEKAEASLKETADQLQADEKAGGTPAPAESDLAAEAVTEHTRAAVEKALTEERQKAAKKGIQTRKEDINAYAKREARFILIGSIFGVAVLAFCALALLKAPALKYFTFAMVGLDAILFVGLVSIIIGHYKAGKEVIRKQKQVREEKRGKKKKMTPASGSIKIKTPGKQEPDTPAKVQQNNNEQTGTEASPSPVPADGASDAGTKPGADKKTAPARMTAAKKGTKGSPRGDGGTVKSNAPSEALKKVARKAAAKRAGRK